MNKFALAIWIGLLGGCASVDTPCSHMPERCVAPPQVSLELPEVVAAPSRLDCIRGEATCVRVRN